MPDAALVARSTEVIQEIASEFRNPVPAWTPDGISSEVRAAVDSSLASGIAGQAVLHAYLARHESDSGEEALVERCLDLAADAAARVPMAASLFGGFAGIAWSLEHLTRHSRHARVESLDDAEDPLASIDDVLIEALDVGSPPDDYDLVSGLTGIGVYALERLPRSRAKKCLGLVIRRLGERVERIDGGRAWRTPNQASGPGAAGTKGPFDLGVAHGVPGVVALLAQSCAWDVAADQARELLGGAVTWLLDQRLDSNARGRFATSAGPGSDHGAARLAWCYGDAGLAAILLTASRAAGERVWAEEALAIARKAATRSEAESGVLDAGLCHGAAGLMLIFQRLHQMSGEMLFAEAATRWLRKVLELHQPGLGLAGFRASVPDEQGGRRYVEDPGLLCGTAGIALALLAATTAVEPEWDRMLLLSSRQPSRIA